MTYPNGWSVGIGDTTQTRVSAEGLELLTAAARERGREGGLERGSERGDSVLETQFAGLLKREMAQGAYSRDKNKSLLALTRYVDELKPAAEMAVPSRSFWGAQLNVFLQRNGDLGAAMYGTDGGHVHANGLALELYGAGVILGPDPGRGSSYWQKDHGEYYSQPPAHNTVIPNGNTTYNPNARGTMAMQIVAAEPASQSPGVSPDISFATGSLTYPRTGTQQLRTHQLRTVALVNGVVVDIFRSRTPGDPKQFHDYLYHNLGQSIDAQGVTLAPSSELQSSKGLLKGYDYFTDEKSGEATSFQAHWTLTTPDGTRRAMTLWSPAEGHRQLFVVNAPPSRAGRESMPAALQSLPMPTIILRQQGDAWEQPFISVFAPSMDAEPSVTRYDASGNLDTSFGTGGTVVLTTTQGFDLTPSQVYMQGDDILVVASTYTTGSYVGSTVVYRLESDGSLDTSFGSGGVVTLSSVAPSGWKSFGMALAQRQEDDGSGSLLVLSYVREISTGKSYPAVTELDPDDGSVITSYGGTSSGTYSAPDNSNNLGAPTAFALDESGGLVIVGGRWNATESKDDGFAIHLYPDGTRDTSFGTSGIAQFTTGQAEDFLAITPDGRGAFIVSGKIASANFSSSTQILVARLLPDGTYDSPSTAPGRSSPPSTLTARANSPSSRPTAESSSAAEPTAWPTPACSTSASSGSIPTARSTRPSAPTA